MSSWKSTRRGRRAEKEEAVRGTTRNLGAEIKLENKNIQEMWFEKNLVVTWDDLEPVPGYFVLYFARSGLGWSARNQPEARREA